MKVAGMNIILYWQRRYDMVTSPQRLNVLRGILLPVFFNICTSAGPVDALKVPSSNSNTKVSRI